MRESVDQVVLQTSPLQRTVGFNAAFAINTSTGSRYGTTPLISCYSRNRCTGPQSNLNRPLQMEWWIRASRIKGAGSLAIESRRIKFGTPRLFMSAGQQQQQRQLVDRSQVLLGPNRDTYTAAAVTATPPEKTALDVFERLDAYERSGAPRIPCWTARLFMYDTSIQYNIISKPFRKTAGKLDPSDPESHPPER